MKSYELEQRVMDHIRNINRDIEHANSKERIELYKAKSMALQALAIQRKEK